MQIRSPKIEIRFAPINLDPSFPIRGGGRSIQKDQPIRYFHVHQCLEIGICYSGTGIFAMGEKVFSYHAGDVSFINHTEPHLARSAPGTHSEWAWLCLDLPNLIGPLDADRTLLDVTEFAGPAFRNIINPSEDHEIAALTRRIVTELADRPPHYRTCVRAQVTELITRVRRIRSQPASHQTRPDYERIAPALQYAAHHFAEPVRLADLARACSVSQATLRRLFDSTIGRSPHAYLTDLRLRMASSLLRTTSRTILEISQDVGFPTLSSFNRLFRRRFQLSPRQWRHSENLDFSDQGLYRLS